MFSKTFSWFLLAASPLGLLSGPLAAQVLGTAPVERAATVSHPLSITPRARLSAALDARSRVSLSGHVHPFARPENDAGPVEESRHLSRMILSLRRDDEQQAALDAFSEAVIDPASPLYHQWLTPEQFGEHFGVASADLDRVTHWLEAQGFQVDEVPAGRWMVVFSGSAAQVQSTFRTPLRYFRTGNERNFANTENPQVPSALAGRVLHIAGLNDFPALSSPKRAAALPQGVSGNGGHFMDPADFAAIYNLNPLYNSGIKGKGVNIAVISPCAVDLSPAAAFARLEGLESQGTWFWYYHGTPQPCASRDADEILFDYEWSGSIAPQAKIWLASADGADPLLTAATGVVNSKLAQVMTMSYARCDSRSYYHTWVSLYQQAHVSGITAMVAAGDWGPHGCGADSDIAINGYCHSEYVTCVGGTQFQADLASPGRYWSPSGRALGYIPESTWNEGAMATGGGYSYFRAKPSWQTGNPYTARGVPDISLSSAGHDGYRYCPRADQCTANWLYTFEGTSAASPSLAGIAALLIQKTGSFHGSLNPTMYALAARNDLGVIFHDVNQGNNALSGEKGYVAGQGWDPVTGLGSIDATALINHWPGAGGDTTKPKFTNQRVTTAAPAATGCSVPPATSTFRTGDANVYLYFEATVTTSDSLSLTWVGPNGKALNAGTWGTISGTYCFTGASLTILNTPDASLGAWQARVSNNGTQVFSVPFTVSR